MKFKENLKKLREKNNLTQKEIANKLGLKLSTYRYIEQDSKDSKTINLELLEQLTKILNCTYDDLLK